MQILVHSIDILLFLILIIYSCSLFTNAIEHLGNSLKLGNNAVGAILAVVGTTLPETVIPVVAVIASLFYKTDFNMAQGIAKGAIIGSPFMLSTLSLFLIALALIIFSKKREKKELNVDLSHVLREYKYFIITYVLAIGAGFLGDYKYIIALILTFTYFYFVYKTIVQSKEEFIESELDKLALSKLFKSEAKILIYLQIVLSLALLVFASHKFINQINWFALSFEINPLVLSLVITPFATELPECINSILWVKDSKDDLALSNVLGAIVFQSTILASVGMVLTDWVFDKVVLINALLTVLCAILIYLSVKIFKKLKLQLLLLAGFFYFLYLIIISLL